MLWRKKNLQYTLMEQFYPAAILLGKGEGRHPTPSRT